MFPLKKSHTGDREMHFPWEKAISWLQKRWGIELRGQHELHKTWFDIFWLHLFKSETALFLCCKLTIIHPCMNISWYNYYWILSFWLFVKQTVIGLSGWKWPFDLANSTSSSWLNLKYIDLPLIKSTFDKVWFTSMYFTEIAQERQLQCLRIWRTGE